MPKNKPIRKGPNIKLPDLAPKKDPLGGGLSYAKKTAFPIPPPGFFASSHSPPHDATPDQNR
jgi:hypothetical protein